MPINLANVDVGSGPSAGDGDTLRSAFITINDNFAKLQVNVNALTNSVTTVAGRTGNVSLTVQDIIGINNLATITYVSSAIANANVTSNLNSLAANISLLQSDVNLLFGNAGIQSGSLAQLTANAAAQAGSLADLTANAAAQAGELGSLLANAGVQAGEISSLLANAGSQHTAISDLQSNAAVQAGLITELQGNVYANSKVAAYLVNYGGNVSVNTIVFDDLSEQYTAYTGTQWRSNLTSDLTVKPSWLSYYPDGLKTVEGTNYGFDASGMFFYGSADNEHAYPIRTNTHLHANDVAEVVATFHLAHVGDDHGIAIFPVGTTPIWKYATDSSRIAWQLNATIPVIYGQSNTATTGNTLTVGNYYTAKFVYDPTNTLTVNVYNGNAAVGSPVDTISLSEALPTGDYVIGFDADQDVVSNRSYFKNLIVRTLTNTIVNDFEVRGQITGNLIPDANVTYSLGNITHQWKDLWVSNSTIYIGGVPITTSNGILTVNNQPVTGASLVNSDGNAQITANDGVISYTWTFETDGSIRTPSDLLTLGGYTLQTNNDNELDLGNGDDITLRANIGNIAIGTDWNTNQYTWQFSNDGNLVLPNGTRIFDIGSIGSDTSGLRLGNHGFTLDFGSEANDWAILYGASLIQVQPESVFNITFAEEANWQFGNTGTMMFPDNTIQTTAWTGDITGNITVGNAAVNFVANSSGDGNGYSTIELHPDTSLGSDQYLIIDPTAPGHIHIRAGGTQDNSGADLILGGEFSHFKLPSGANTSPYITSNGYSWQFGTNGILTLPNSGLIYDSNFIAGPGQNAVLGQNDGNTQVYTQQTGVGIQSYSAGTYYTWTFDNTGVLTFPSGGNVVFDASSVSVIDGVSSIVFADSTTQNTAYSNAAVGIYLADNTAKSIGGNVTIDGNLFVNGNISYISTNSYVVADNIVQFADSNPADSLDLGFVAHRTVNGTLQHTGFVRDATDGKWKLFSNVVPQVGQTVDFTNAVYDDVKLGNVIFGDATTQTTAWTGTVLFGNTIAIGYQTGNTSQGNNAVAIGSVAGQTSQGAKAIGIGEVAGRLNQGIESIGLGAGAGEQNQGAYAIAIGSTTAYLNQGVGAVAIGTSAGALYQGEHAIAIGTGAGNGLQGNNSIILNATGTTLDQTTDDTFTVKPIRSASAGNVLYYNPTSGEITYSTNSSYGNAEVATYLPTYSGNISATVNGFVIGYRDVPQVSAGNVTLGLTDAGKHYYSTASAPTTLTIPSNANVAFSIGTAITVVNSGTGNITISKQAEANLYLAGNSTSATRTLTSYGMATLLKTATDQWFINGTGLV